VTAASKATAKLAAAEARIETTTATPAPPSWTPSDGKALVLRTCAPDLTSYAGYAWPGIGETATAPDWDPTPTCGRGLHGLLWVAGNASLLSSAADAVWLVVEVDAASCIDLDRKVKFPVALVVHAGTRQECVDLIQQHAPVGTRVVYGTCTSGYGGTSTSGYGGTCTSGDRGILVISYYDAALGHRKAFAAVGVDGILPGVAYRLDDQHRFVAVDEAAEAGE
jgi:hypothetical protein